MALLLYCNLSHKDGAFCQRGIMIRFIILSLVVLKPVIGIIIQIILYKLLCFMRQMFSLGILCIHSLNITSTCDAKNLRHMVTTPMCCLGLALFLNRHSMSVSERRHKNIHTLAKARWVKKKENCA